MTNETKTIKQLASEFLGFFEKKEREGRKFWCKTDDAPEALNDLVYLAHVESSYLYTLPDDWSYQFVVEALSALSDYDNADDAIESIDADCYTSELCDWLASSVYRMEYLDNALKECEPNNGFSALAMAQREEKKDVFWSVKSSLESIQKGVGL